MSGGEQYRKEHWEHVAVQISRDINQDSYSGI